MCSLFLASSRQYSLGNFTTLHKTHIISSPYIVTTSHSVVDNIRLIKLQLTIIVCPISTPYSRAPTCRRPKRRGFHSCPCIKGTNFTTGQTLPGRLCPDMTHQASAQLPSPLSIPPDVHPLRTKLLRPTDKEVVKATHFRTCQISDTSFDSKVSAFSVHSLLSNIASKTLHDYIK